MEFIVKDKFGHEVERFNAYSYTAAVNTMQWSYLNWDIDGLTLWSETGTQLL